jgi:hypothetical protein
MADVTADVDMADGAGAGDDDGAAAAEWYCPLAVRPPAQITLPLA